MLVYIDESGDLGFTKKSTRYHATAYVVCDIHFMIEKQIRRLLKDLHAKGKYSLNYNELKWSRSNDDVKRRVLMTIRDMDVYLGCILLDKCNVYPHLRQPPIVYNYQIVHFMLWDLLPTKFKPSKGMKVYLDQSLSKQSRKAFNMYFRNKVSWIWTQELHRPAFDFNCIEIFHENSESCRCLQVADYVAGAVFTKFERGESYLDLLQNKVQVTPCFSRNT